MLVSCCFSPGWNNKETVQKLSASTKTHKNTHTTDFPPAAHSPPSHQYIEKSAASENASYAISHTYIHARGRDCTRREIYASKSKENAFDNELFCLFSFLNKKCRLVFSENLMLSRKRGTQRCWFCFVLRFFKHRGRNINTNTYIHTHWNENLYERLSNKNTNTTTTTLAHIQKATGKGWLLKKGWNKYQNWSTNKTQIHGNTLTRWHLRHLH